MLYRELWVLWESREVLYNNQSIYLLKDQKEPAEYVKKNNIKTGLNKKWW